MIKVAMHQSNLYLTDGMIRDNQFRANYLLQKMDEYALKSVTWTNLWLTCALHSLTGLGD